MEPEKSRRNTVSTETIVEELNKINAQYELIKHGHVHTVDDAVRERGTKKEESAKALIVETDRGVIMCVIRGDRKLSLKKLKKLIKAKKASLARKEIAEERTGLKVGTIPPTGKLFNLPTLIDEKLMENKRIAFSAASHYESIITNPNDLVKLCGGAVKDISE